MKKSHWPLFWKHYKYFISLPSLIADRPWFMSWLQRSVPIDLSLSKLLISILLWSSRVHDANISSHCFLVPSNCNIKNHILEIMLSLKKKTNHNQSKLSILYQNCSSQVGIISVRPRLFNISSTFFKTHHAHHLRDTWTCRPKVFVSLKSRVDWVCFCIANQAKCEGP